jgi:tRNA uridine 5-carbamoylmethylation protein Kti12
MKLINLYGAPCSGKSKMAAHLFSKLKETPVKCELVGEVAKELIYLGNEVQLVNQVYILGCQYRKLKDLERNGIDVAISDSPLLLQLIYSQEKTYYDEIKALVLKLNSEFDNYDILLNRVTPYQQYGRVNTEAEAEEIHKKVVAAMKDQIKLSVNSNTRGTKTLTDYVLKIANS